MKDKISLLFLFLFLFLFFSKSQNLDKLAGIPNDYFKEEIRIYKDRGITNSGTIFRIYKENTVWKAERIQWFWLDLINQMSPRVCLALCNW